MKFLDFSIFLLKINYGIWKHFKLSFLFFNYLLHFILLILFQPLVLTFYSITQLLQGFFTLFLIILHKLFHMINNLLLKPIIFCYITTTNFNAFSRNIIDKRSKSSIFFCLFLINLLLSHKFSTNTTHKLCWGNVFFLLTVDEMVV